MEVMELFIFKVACLAFAQAIIRRVDRVIGIRPNENISEVALYFIELSATATVIFLLLRAIGGF